MTRHLIAMALAAAILATAGAPVATAGEKATVKASAAWVGQGRIFQVVLRPLFGSPRSEPVRGY